MRFAWLAAWLCAMIFMSPAAAAHDNHAGEQSGKAGLPVIARATDFTLEDHKGQWVRLSAQRGHVVVITFIYTSCREVCHLLTARLVEVLREAGPAAGKVVVLAITVDPEHDSRTVLNEYAESQGATGKGWHFLRGQRPQVERLAAAYGVAIRRQSNGDIDHTLLTSLVDPRGDLRVQYSGARFRVSEFVDDLAQLTKP